MYRAVKLFEIFLFIALFFSAVSFVYGQSTSNLEKDIKEKLNDLNQKISTNRGEISNLENLNDSLEKDVKILTSNITKTELKIEATNLEINNTKNKIGNLKNQIDSLQIQIIDKEGLLADNLKEVYKSDKVSLLELILMQKDFTEFFSGIEYINVLQGDINTALGQLKVFKKDFDEKRLVIDGQLVEQERLYVIQDIQFKDLSNIKNYKNNLISKNVSKSIDLEVKNKQYKELIAQLREQLYVISGLAKGINLGEAYNMASNVSQKTGLDPLFLMAIIKVESDWGGNIGGGNWRKDMKPQEQDAFIKITKKLGYDPDKMPVSSAPSYGWGGAIGPAQFLPRTWLENESQIIKITGNNPPDPWTLEDAFAAAAIKLSRDGASAQTPNAELRAAMIYFAGSRWNNPAYSFYGDRVMDVKEIIKSQLN
ncbi:MAG: Membrane protein metalloendopeptidase [Parcubacteria group bacterium GW2011_GWA2_31_28]|nr:MAG: Membrane protein metalloendopeptidase [Parcubacteria group bacterium GW2011_GWA2_31_28]